MSRNNTSMSNKHKMSKEELNKYSRKSYIQLAIFFVSLLLLVMAFYFISQFMHKNSNDERNVDKNLESSQSQLASELESKNDKSESTTNSEEVSTSEDKSKSSEGTKSTTTFDPKMREIYESHLKGTVKLNDMEVLERLQSENKEKSVVYVGRATCPDCYAFVPILEEAMKEIDHTIYYYDCENMSSEVREYLSGLGLEYIPSILKVESDQITITQVANENKKEDIVSLINDFFAES